MSNRQYNNTSRGIDLAYLFVDQDFVDENDEEFIRDRCRQISVEHDDLKSCVNETVRLFEDRSYPPINPILKAEITLLSKIWFESQGKK